MPSLQTPLGSGFGPATRADEALAGIDLSGKTAIVTGGYSGIGTETARALRAAGARVIVPARDTQKARAALDGLDVELAAMDLTSPASIDAFAAGYVASGQPLHFLIHSAGVMACPLTRDARGFELQFATNHLGHFQLAARLWPALVSARGARVVALSSLGHRYATVDIDDPNFERREYDRWIAYGQSKSANALFAVALNARGEAHGVQAFSVHPGRIVTDLARHMSVEELQKIGALDEHGQPVIDLARGMKSPSQGAATSVWAATSPQLDDFGGIYCEDCDIAALAPEEDVTTPGSASIASGVRPWAVDPVAAERLWTLSERMLGVRL
jgi:NAD(P)-dependent dehydrogenase (short-subunit alcohol dehydrogenase family)